MRLYRIVGNNICRHPNMPAFYAERAKATNSENPNGIVTCSNPEEIDLGEKVFDFYQFCEDGFPYLSYLAMGDCMTGQTFLSREESNMLSELYGDEQAVYMWFKEKGYTAVICRYYDQPDGGRQIHYVWLIN